MCRLDIDEAVSSKSERQMHIAKVLKNIEREDKSRLCKIVEPPTAFHSESRHNLGIPATS